MHARTLTTALIAAYLLAPASAQAQSFNINEVCPQEQTFIELEDLGGAVLDYTGFGSRIDFRPQGPEVCVAEDTIYVAGNPSRIFPCEDVMNSEGGINGSVFMSEGRQMRLWLFIDPEAETRTLQMGFYEGSTGENQFFWLETGASLCNG